MHGYWRRIVECGRDIHLFMAYALISYLGIGVFALVFNLYLVQLGYDEGFIGAFNAVYTLSMGITCLALGFLINRFGNWACLTLGTAEFVGSLIVLALVSSGPMLLMLSALNGIGSAFIMAAQMPFVIEWTPRRHTATIAALSSALSSGSVMIGSLIGGLLPGAFASILDVHSDSITAYRWTIIVGAIITVFSLVPNLMMGDARRNPHHADFRVSSAQLLSHRVRRQARRDVSALILLGLFLALGVGAIEPFYNVLLKEMGSSASTIGIIFAISGLGATVLSLAGPPLAQRVGFVGAQLWTRLFHVPIHLLLIFIPSPLIVSLAYAGRKISGSMSWPLESAHAGGLVPPQARAYAFGLRSAAWNIGYAIAAFASGQVIARTGSYTPAYIALALFSFFSVMVYAVAFGGRMPGGESEGETPAAVEAAGATLD